MIFFCDPQALHPISYNITFSITNIVTILPLPHNMHIISNTLYVLHELRPRYMDSADWVVKVKLRPRVAAECRVQVVR